MTAFLSLLTGTFVSEDLACVTAGLLVQRGDMSAPAAILACATGIFLGDVGLWAMGRLGGLAACSWPWLTRQLERNTADSRHWLEQRAASAIVESRFLPGTRLPLYLLAGVLGLPLVTFASWAALAALVWTPVVVMTTATLGPAIRSGGSESAGFIANQWAANAFTVATVLSLLAIVRTVTSAPTRMRMAARFSRYVRWEFWPMWLFYAPVAAWVTALAVRHRGFSTITAANPGMADGGTVGESKSEILARLPSDCTIPFAFIPAGSPATRAQVALAAMEREGWTFPIILKPDVGQRGLGVRLARSPEDVAQYFARARGEVVLQKYHEGPFEAGVFYYRMPGEARGRILSITDKRFPFVVGDGLSTLKELVWAHPRYRMQAATFLSRHHDVRHRILPAGESFQLAIAGNHAQGTIFRNGWHLWTPELEARIDAIARAYGGFFVGRFDIRYSDVAGFKAGTDLALVELNGATAESTSIYDPDGSLWSAYRELFRQWSLVFAIGAANRARGSAVTSHRRLFELIRVHATSKTAFPVSD